ncbi:MAG: hypothetical protein KDA78_04270 [Planctomycetaceae bacterium]|nr:hypothetical protein [Planctomycetaceae bacterium]
MNPIRRVVIALVFACAGFSSGCAIVEVAVSNPTPNLPRIAIAPFVNLSPERSVDGRRFAEAYYTELQKTPGFQVIPVGVVETAMVEHGLNLDSPADLLKLVEILEVDSICFGAITEYTPYYPPRLGMQVSWYTPGIADFKPGIAIDPYYRQEQWLKSKEAREKGTLKGRINKAWKDLSCTVSDNSTGEESQIRGQNADGEIDPLQAEWDRALQEALQLKYEERPPLPLPVHIATEPWPLAEREATDENSEVVQASGQLIMADPLSAMAQPYMSYTRVFDGADAEFTASLRNYLELSGDQRSGGWTGHLHRSEDFIRFCMHRMILEMLQLHGGESRKQWVVMPRKYH